ncbi:MAG: dodecin [Endozoicomonas sp.]
MSHTYKLTELVGSSTVSSDDAIQNAIAAAGMSMEHMGWFEVVETRGHIDNGTIAHWQVTVKIGFRIKGGD